MVAIVVVGQIAIINRKNCDCWPRRGSGGTYGGHCASCCARLCGKCVMAIAVIALLDIKHRKIR